MTIDLQAGDARATLNPLVGGRLASLQVAELSLLVERRDDPFGWGCFPMAPWAGRVRQGKFRFEGVPYELPLAMPPHAIHGTTYNREWSIEDKGESEARLSIDLGSDWPFAGRAVQQIRLQPDALSLRLEVHSPMRPFPASLGWHPWFKRQLARGESARLSLSARSLYVRDAQGIPTGQRVTPGVGPWDDCFGDLDHDPRLTWPGALELTLSSSAGYWVVYDEPVDALCVEPETSAPDALNRNPTIVAPDHPLVLDFQLRWEPV